MKQDAVHSAMVQKLSVQGLLTGRQGSLCTQGFPAAAAGLNTHSSMQYQAEQAALIVTHAVPDSPPLPLRGAHSAQHAAMAAVYSPDTQHLMISLVIPILMPPPYSDIELSASNV